MKNRLLLEGYREVGVLGEGATARVYLCIYEALNQHRAVKCIDKASQAYELAKREAKLLLQMRFSAIPIIYDIREDEETLYIIEEYMEGESLLSYRRQSQALSESTILNISLQICDIFLYLHSMKIPLLYLDCKPSNFIIHNDEVKLIDFGSCRWKQSGVFKESYGTKGFAAPEQYKKEYLDEITDVYGIGMLLYFLMTGVHHFHTASEKYQSGFSNYSKRLQSIVQRAIRHNSCERYASVKAIKSKLQALSNKTKQVVSSKRIALVGAQKGVGVTHLSLTILSELHRMGKCALYVECGLGHVVEAYALIASKVTETKVYYKGLTLTRLCWLDPKEIEDYEYIIYDYGLATKETIARLEAADCKIAVLGGQVWELQAANRLIQQLEEQPQVKYVLNHSSALGFHQLIRPFHGIEVLRMPQNPEVIGSSLQGVKDLVLRLLE